MKCTSLARAVTASCRREAYRRRLQRSSPMCLRRKRTPLDHASTQDHSGWGRTLGWSILGHLSRAAKTAVSRPWGRLCSGRRNVPEEKLGSVTGVAVIIERTWCHRQGSVQRSDMCARLQFSAMLTSAAQENHCRDPLAAFGSLPSGGYFLTRQMYLRYRLLLSCLVCRRHCCPSSRPSKMVLLRFARPYLCRPRLHQCPLRSKAFVASQETAPDGATKKSGARAKTKPSISRSPVPRHRPSQKGPVPKTPMLPRYAGGGQIRLICLHNTHFCLADVS